MEDKLKESQPGGKEAKKDTIQVTKVRWQDRLDRQIKIRRPVLRQWARREQNKR